MKGLKFKLVLTALLLAGLLGHAQLKPNSNAELQAQAPIGCSFATASEALPLPGLNIGSPLSQTAFKNNKIPSCDFATGNRSLLGFMPNLDSFTDLKPQLNLRCDFATPLVLSFDDQKTGDNKAKLVLEYLQQIIKIPLDK